MAMTTRRSALCALAAASLLPSLAGAQEGAPVKGAIVSLKGARFVMRTAMGDQRVRISDSTKVQSSAGVLGVRKINRLPSELIPGLVVEVRGGMNGKTLMAHEILFTDDDLKAAQQARAAHAAR
jgi:hypothetical protein